LTLTDDDLAQIARILPHGAFGARYPEGRAPVWE
jgi:hypothetical protein